MGNKTLNETLQPAPVHSYPPHPQSPGIPIELIRRIISLYLADVFWDLIAKLGLACVWDPLSPLLHTNFQFRELTTSFLVPLVGEAYVEPKSRTVRHRPLLAKLKQFKLAAQTDIIQTFPVQRDDPQTFLAGHSTPAPSPIITLADEFSTKMLHLHLHEDTTGPGIQLDQSERVMPEHVALAERSSDAARDVPPSIGATVLRPLQERAIELQLLLQRIVSVQALCGCILEYIPGLLNSTEDAIAQDLTGLEEHRARMKRAAGGVDRMVAEAEEKGYVVARLPISDAALEGMRFARALEVLGPPPGRAAGSSLVELCSRDRELLMATAGQAVDPVAEEVRELGCREETGDQLLA